MNTPTAHIREIHLKSNLNNKIGSKHILHIQLAGPTGIAEPQSEKIIFRFISGDNTAPPTDYKIYDSIRTTLLDLPEYVIQLSHGMTKTEFINQLYKKRPDITPSSNMVAYLYQLVTDTTKH